MFDENAGQKEVFDRVGFPLVEDLLQGKNGMRRLSYKSPVNVCACVVKPYIVKVSYFINKYLSLSLCRAPLCLWHYQLGEDVHYDR